MLHLCIFELAYCVVIDDNWHELSVCYGYCLWDAHWDLDGYGFRQLHWNRQRLEHSDGFSVPNGIEFIDGVLKRDRHAFSFGYAVGDRHSYRESFLYRLRVEHWQPISKSRCFGYRYNQRFRDQQLERER